MGNTGTALAVDGAAPFLNPATIVRMDEHRFAFSVNFYQWSNTRFSNWHQPGTVDTAQFGNLALSNTSISSGGFNVLPSTLCLFLTLSDGAAAPSESESSLHPGRQKLSACLGSTENQGVSFTALPFTGTTPLGLTTQAQSLVQSWSRFYGGPSYSVSITHHLALGASLHVVYTNDSFAFASSAITTSAMGGGVQSSFGVAGGGNSLDLAATLGAIYRVGAYTAGVSMAFPAVHVSGSYTGTLDSQYTAGTAGTATISEGTGSFSAGPPVRVAMGAGAEWGRLTMEADAAIVIPAPNGFTASASGTTATLAAGKLSATAFQSTFGVREHVVANPGIGAEFFVNKTFSVIAGASLNMTLEPPLSPALGVGTLVEERQSVGVVSAGVGSYSEGGSLLLGVQVGHGWGQSLAANPYVTPNQWAVVDTSSYSVLVILAGSTSLRSLGHAAARLEHEAEHLEHVVVGGPTKPEAPAPVVPQKAPAPSP
jgi:hypothetical protein